jgi:hypothetical protein
MNVETMKWIIMECRKWENAWCEYDREYPSAPKPPSLNEFANRLLWSVNQSDKNDRLPQPLKEKCSNCHYAHWLDGAAVEMKPPELCVANGRIAECRRHPPVVNEHGPRRFPHVFPDDWCGDFELKETE